MATQFSYLKMDAHATDAEWRATARAPGDALVAFGWVKTTDTGQIDWATVLRPTAANQFRGYEIFRMADALQATTPMFLKLEYGSGAATNLWSWRLTLSTSTSGTGVMTGQVGNPVTFTQAGGATAGTTDVSGNFKCLFSGATHRFTAIMAPLTGSSLGAGYFIIERFKSNNGSDGATGGVIIGQFGNSNPTSSSTPSSGPIPPLETAGVGCVVPSAGTGMVGTDVHIYTVHPFVYAMQNPVRGLAAYFTADLPSDQIITASIYGIEQSWYTVPVNGGSGPARSGGNQTKPLLRFE